MSIVLARKGYAEYTILVSDELKVRRYRYFQAFTAWCSVKYPDEYTRIYFRMYPGGEVSQSEEFFMLVGMMDEYAEESGRIFPR